jgi:hypothetical protein
MDADALTLDIRLRTSSIVEGIEPGLDTVQGRRIEDSKVRDAYYKS